MSEWPFLSDQSIIIVGYNDSNLDGNKCLFGI